MYIHKNTFQTLESVPVANDSNRTESNSNIAEKATGDGHVVTNAHKTCRQQSLAGIQNKIYVAMF